MYRLNKRKRDWISWQCREKNCAATASTANDIVTMVSNNHNHPPVHNEIKVGTPDSTAVEIFTYD